MNNQKNPTNLNRIYRLYLVSYPEADRAFFEKPHTPGHRDVRVHEVPTLLDEAKAIIEPTLTHADILDELFV